MSCLVALTSIALHTAPAGRNVYSLQAPLGAACSMLKMGFSSERHVAPNGALRLFLTSSTNLM